MFTADVCVNMSLYSDQVWEHVKQDQIKSICVVFLEILDCNSQISFTHLKSIANCKNNLKVTK